MKMFPIYGDSGKEMEDTSMKILMCMKKNLIQYLIFLFLKGELTKH